MGKITADTRTDITSGPFWYLMLTISYNVYYTCVEISDKMNRNVHPYSIEPVSDILVPQFYPVSFSHPTSVKFCFLVLNKLVPPLSLDSWRITYRTEQNKYTKDVI